MNSPLSVTSLHLTPELAEKIRNLSFEGLKALPRRGAEIGGLITADPSTLSVADEVRLVESEHFFGPSYQLSDRDLLRMHNAAGECRKAGRSIVAYFRSSTRPNDEVDADDRRVIADVSPDTTFAVIARPANNGSARIRIFRAEGSDRWTLFEELNTPSSGKSFLASRAPKMQPQEALRALGSTASASSGYPHAPEANPGDRALRPAEVTSGLSSWRSGLAARRLVVAMLGLTGIVILGVVLFRTRVGSRSQSEDVPPESRVSRQSALLAAPPGGGLGLAVRPEVRQLHLTWNRDSLAVKTATFGLLQILDGTTPVSIELASSDLTEGSFIYTPHSQDVTFRLRLGTTSGQSAEEAIRVFGATPLQSTDVAADAAGASTLPPEREAEIRPVTRPAISNPPPVRTQSRKASPRPTLQKIPSRAATTSKSRPQPPQSQVAQSRTAQPTPSPDTAHQNSAPVADVTRQAQPTVASTPGAGRAETVPPSRETF